MTRWPRSGGTAIRALFCVFLMLVDLEVSCSLQLLWPSGDEYASNVDIVVPQSAAVVIKFSGTYNAAFGPVEVKQGDGVAVISPSQSCSSSIDFSIGAATSGAGTGSKQLGQRLEAVFDFTNVAASLQQYKICICEKSANDIGCPDGSGIEDTDNVLQVQNDVTGLNVDGKSVTFATIPLQHCTGDGCSTKHFNSVQYQRLNPGTINQLSLIPLTRDCEMATANPRVATDGASSGFLSTNLDREVTDFDAVNRMRAGTYKLCVSPTAGTVYNWRETGIALRLQDSIALLEVNGIRDISSYAPQVAGVSVRTCLTWNCSRSGSSLDQISFISTDIDCDFPASNPPEAQAGAASGHLGAPSTGISQLVLDALVGPGGLLGVGTFHVCFKPEGMATFMDTGLTFTVQKDVLGLEVNLVRMASGLVVSAPQTSKVLLKYFRATAGVAGDSFALLQQHRHCAELCGSSRVPDCDQTKPSHFSDSGILSAHFTDFVISDIPCLGAFASDPTSCRAGLEKRAIDLQNIAVGQYKVCHRPASAFEFFTSWPVWRGTGVSVTVQNTVLGMVLNGQGGTVNTGHAQRLTLPLSTYHHLSFFGNAPGGGVLCVGNSSGRCSDMFGPESSADNNPTCTERMAAEQQGSKPVIDRLLGPSGALSGGVYQWCFLGHGQSAFIGTGVSLSVQDNILGIEVNNIRPNNGVRVAIPAGVPTTRLIHFRNESVNINDVISLIPFARDCENPEDNTMEGSGSVSGLLNLTVVQLVFNSTTVVFRPMDRIVAMAEGNYKVCFGSADRVATDLHSGFHETGISAAVQRQLTSLHANQREPPEPTTELLGASSQGVRVGLPMADGNLLVASGPGMVSFIDPAADCSSVAETGDNPSTSAEGRILHLRTQGDTNSLPGGSLDLVLGRAGVKLPGLLQVCFTPSDAAHFVGTGISVNLQPVVTGLLVNKVEANFGLRAAIPQDAGSRIQYVIAEGQGGHVNDTLSLIPTAGDCSSMADNPEMQSDIASGFMMVGNTEATFDGLETIAELEVGQYQVCFRRALADRFISTGIVITIQNQIFALTVNGVQSLASAAPKTDNNEIGFCLNAACTRQGTPGNAISFITSKQECEDTQVQNPPTASLGKSGYMVTRGRDNQLPQKQDAISVGVEQSLGDNGVLGLETFQVCFRPAGDDAFTSTGLSLRVNDRIIGVHVNGVSPNFGLHTVVPRVPNNVVGYWRNFNGIPGDTVVAIPLDGVCENPRDTPQEGDATHSGYWTAASDSRILSGTESIEQMDLGTYQVCFRGFEEREFTATGIMLSVHEDITSIQVNSQTQGLTGVLPKRPQNVVTFYGTNVIDATTASLVLPRSRCSDTDSANHPLPGVSRSGHDLFVMTPGFNLNIPIVDSVLVDESVLRAMTYQLCLEIGGEWKSTGIGITTEVHCLPEPGVRTEFESLWVKESNQLASSMNAITVVMKTRESLPFGGVLTITGLPNSLTFDDGLLDIDGGQVSDDTVSVVCASPNRTCRVTLRDFVPSGHALVEARLSIAMLCTDLDSCGEGIAVARLNGKDFVNELTNGPWVGCSYNCAKREYVLQQYNIWNEIGIEGNPLEVELEMTTDVGANFACNGNILDALISLDITTSRLSTHALQGSWTQLTGTLVLPLVPYTDQEYIFLTFLLKNPSDRHPAQVPAASICALTTGGGEVPRTTMEVRPSGQAGVLSAAVEPNFIATSLTQSTILPGGLNRLSVVIRTNLPSMLPTSLVVTVSGLTGSKTRDNAELALLTPAGQIDDVYECVGAKSCLVDVSAGSRRFHRASLSVDIYCSDLDATDRSKHIEMIRACTPGSPTDTCEGLSAITFSSATYSTGPWQQCKACSESTRPVLINYDAGDLISQLGTNFSLEIQLSPGVSDLHCYGAYPAFRSTRALVRLTVEYAEASGKWTVKDGELIFRALPQITSCSSPDPRACLPEIRFDFELENPDQDQPPVVPVLSARGGGLIFDGIPLQPVLGIDTLSGIRFTRADLTESTQVNGNPATGAGLNELTLSLETSNPLPAGTVITISGLLGSQTTSENCVAVESPQCSNPTHCIWSSTDTTCQRGLPLLDFSLGSALAGSWDQASGTIQFVVQPSFQNLQQITLRFSLYNPAAEQSPRQAALDATVPRSLVENRTIDGRVLQGGVENAVPRSRVPDLDVALIGESNKVEGQLNTLSITLQSSVTLHTGTLIQVMGLEGSRMQEGQVGGGVWYGPALPYVQDVTIDGQGLAPLGQWQDIVQGPPSSVCLDSGWVLSDDRYWSRSAAGDVIPSRVQQRWCYQQPNNSVVVRLNRCFLPGEDISFRFALNNGRVFDGRNVAVMLSGSAVQSEPQNLTVTTLQLSRSSRCVGDQACSASIIHDERCLDDTCRYLPTTARLSSARLSINLRCSDFGETDKLIERVGLCAAPDCVALFGEDFAWSGADTACCSVQTGCQQYECLETIAEWETGPWQGCMGACLETRPVLSRFDVTNIVCAGQSPDQCTTPKTLVVVLAVSANVEQGCDGNVLDANVHMDVAFRYEGAGFASEVVRLTLVDMEESNRVRGSLSWITVRLRASGSITRGSVLTISELKRVATNDTDTLPVETVGCTAKDGFFSCVPDGSQLVASEGMWRREEGVLTVQFLESVPESELFAFRFQIRNPVTSGPELTGSVLIDVIGEDQALGPTLASSSLLSASQAPAIAQFSIVEATSVIRETNTLYMTMRCTFEIETGTVVTISGFAGMEMPDGAGVTILGSGFVLQGVWNQTQQLLTFEIEQTLEAALDHALEFSLVNPSEIQPARPLTMSMTLFGGVTLTRRLGAASTVMFPQQVPGFLIARIREGSSIAGDTNHLTVRFVCNTKLTMGSKILIAGLQGSQTEDSHSFRQPLDPNLAVVVDVALCPQAAQVKWYWMQSRGDLILFLPCEVPVGTPVSVEFDLRNPIENQIAQSPLLGASTTETSMMGRVLGPVLSSSDRAFFILALSAESTRVQGETTRVTVQLQLNVGIPKDSAVFLFGVSGTARAPNPNTDDRSVQVFQADDQGRYTELRADIFRFDFGLEVAVQFLVDIPERTLLTFVVNNLDNTPPEFPELPALFWSKENQRDDPNLVVGNLGSILPSVSRTGTISLATIEESAKTLGSVNTLTATIIADFNIGLDATFTISGLTGSLSPSGIIPVEGPDQAFLGGVGNWTDDGVLALQVAQPSIREAGMPMVFSFNLLNPIAAQEAGASPSVFFSKFMAEPTPFSSPPVLLANSEPTWTQARIGEATSVREQQNRITVTLTCDVLLEAGTNLTLSGLQGSRTEAGPIPIGGPGVVWLNNSYWRPSAGVLSVEIAKQIPPRSDIIFWFSIQNPPFRQNSQAATVYATQGFGSSLDVTVQPRVAEGRVLEASQAPGFVSVDVRESNNFQGAENELQFVIQATLPLPAGTNITITNLRGSSTPSTGALPIQSDVVSPKARWDQGGTLVVSLLSLVDPFTEFSFTFTILNPSSRQDPPTPIISTDSIEETAVLATGLEWHEGILRWKGFMEPSASQGQVLSGARQLELTSLQVSEQTLVVGQPNLITLSMRANSDLLPGALITVEGLLGSQTLDKASMLMQQQGKDTFGRWLNVFGMLAFSLDELLPEGDQLVVTFSLVNPAKMQVPVLPTVTMQTTQNGLLVRTAPKVAAVAAGSVCCLQGSEQQAIVNASIRESTSVPGQQNVIYLSFTSNVFLPVGTLITLSGLGASPTPADNALPISNSSRLIGQWSRDRGELVVALEAQYFDCECVASCDQDSVLLSFQLQNPTTPQAAPRLELQVNRVGQGSPVIQIQTEINEANVLQAQVMQGFAGWIQGSSTVPGEMNDITVSLKANSAIEVCPADWISGDASWIIDGSGATEICPWRGANPCFPAAQLMDGLIGDRFGVEIADAGTRYIELDLGQPYRVEGYRLHGTQLAASVQMARLLYASRERAPASEWLLAGSILVQEMADYTPSVWFPTVVSQHWRLVVDSNWDAFVSYKYSQIQELQLYGCVDTLSTRIQVTNLTGFDTPTDPMLPIRSDVGVRGVRAEGSWQQDAGILEVKMRYPSIAYENVGFTFSLQNPATEQQPREVSLAVYQGESAMTAKAVGVLFERDVVVATPPPATPPPPPPPAQEQRAGGFLLALIGDSSRIAGAMNLISVTLQPDVDILQGTTITILGLNGSTTGTEAAEGVQLQLANQEPAGTLQSTLHWHNTGCDPTQRLPTCGRAVVQVAANPWPRRQTLVFSWHLQNSPSMRAVTGDVQVLTQLAEPVVASFCKVANESGPGCVEEEEVLVVDREPGFVEARIHEGSNTQNQPNLITVTLVANVELVFGTRITLSGLLGTRTASNQGLPLQGDASFRFGFAGDWDQTTGTLIVEAQGSLNSASSPTVVFAFLLSNALAPQPASNITITASLPNATMGSCSALLCDVGFGINEKALAPFGEALPMHKATAALLQALEGPQFSLRTITESTNVPNEDSLITIVLQSNLLLAPGTVVTFTGLLGTQTVDTDFLPLDISTQECEPLVANPPTCSGVWKQRTGKLTVTLSNPLLAGQGNVTIMFWLRNPATAQAKAAADVSSNGVATKLLDGDVLASDGVADFTSLTIDESSSVAGELNFITVRAVANTALSHGAVVTISRLLGRGEALQLLPCTHAVGSVLNVSLGPLSVSVIDDSGATAVDAVDNMVSLLQSDSGCTDVDSFVRFELPRSYAIGSRLSFTFAVTNSDPPRSEGTIALVTVAGCRASSMLGSPPLCSLTGQDERCTGCESEGDRVVISRIADKEILHPNEAAQVLASSVDEGTFVVSALSELTVTFTLNFALRLGARITISGLVGSQTTSDPSMQVRGRDSDLFGHSGEWNQTTGQMVLTLAVESILSTRELQVAFSVVNLAAQQQARCTFGEPFCDGGEYEGRACPTLGATCAGVCSGGLPYCSQGVVGDCSQFTLPAQRPAADRACPGGFCVAPNVGEPCPPNSLLELVNATFPYGRMLAPAGYEGTFYQAADGTLQPRIASQCDGGGTCGGTGTCIAPNTGELCTMHEQCTGWYVPGQGIVGTQRCARLPSAGQLQIAVTSGGLATTPVTVSGDVFGFSTPVPPEFTTREISEDNQAILGANTLHVRLVANFDLQRVEETVVTMTGFQSGTPDNHRLPILSGVTPEVYTESCVASAQDRAFSCRSIGSGTVRPAGLVVRARLDLEVQCWPDAISDCASGDEDSPNCFLVTELRIGCAILHEGFARAPCRGRIDGRNYTSDGFVKVIESLDVRTLLRSPDEPSSCQYDRTQGFQAVLRSSSAVLGARTRLELLHTEQFGNWTQRDGSLVVHGANATQIKTDTRTLSLRFVLENPATPAPPSQITVIGRSGITDRIGVCDDPVEPGCTTRGEPSAARTILQGSVLTASRTPPLTLAAISETSNVPSAPNLLTVSLSPQTGAIPGGTVVTLSGLNGDGMSQFAFVPVIGTRTAALGVWSKTVNSETNQLETSMEVTVLHAPPFPSPSQPLVFSFPFTNPPATTAAVLPTVVVHGGGMSFGGADSRLVCATQQGCSGILAAARQPTFVLARVEESHRLVNSSNALRFFLTANVPLMNLLGTVTISGFGRAAPWQGDDKDIELLASPAQGVRSDACAAFRSCVINIDATPPPGTIMARTTLTVAVQCEEYIGPTTILVCGRELSGPDLAASPCSHEYQFQDALVRDYEPQGCTDNQVVVDVQSLGWLRIEANVTVAFAFDTSAGTARWTNDNNGSAALSLSVTPNMTAGSPTLTDPSSLAFSLPLINPPMQNLPVKPQVSGVIGGIELAPTPMETNSISGLLASGVEECQLAQVLVDTGVFPASGRGVNSQTFSVDGQASCFVVVQPQEANGQYVSITILDFDMDPDDEELAVHEGDTPNSPKIGTFFNPSTAGSLLGQAGYFEVGKSMFFHECSVTFSYVAKPQVREDAMQHYNFSSGRKGFSFEVSFQNPNRTNYLVLVMSLQGVSSAPPATQLKMRKIIATTILVYRTHIIFDSFTPPARRSDEEDGVTGSLSSDGASAHGASRTLSQSSGSMSMRVLAESRADVEQFSTLLKRAFDAGSVTAAMKVAGIAGSAEFSSITPFRCDVELVCTDETPAPPATTVAPTTPAPVEEEGLDTTRVISLVGAIVGPSVVVGLCSICGLVWYTLRRMRRRRYKAKKASQEYERWVKNMIQSLSKKKNVEVAALCDENDIIMDEEDMQTTYKQLANVLFWVTPGLGLDPAETDFYVYYEKGVYEPKAQGHWGHVPVRLREEAMAFKASNAAAKKDTKAKGKGGKKDAKSGAGKAKSNSATANGSLAFQVPSKPEMGTVENGEVAV